MINAWLSRESFNLHGFSLPFALWCSSGLCGFLSFFHLCFISWFVDCSFVFVVCLSVSLFVFVFFLGKVQESVHMQGHSETKCLRRADPFTFNDLRHTFIHRDFLQRCTQPHTYTCARTHTPICVHTHRRTYQTVCMHIHTHTDKNISVCAHTHT